MRDDDLEDHPQVTRRVKW